MTDYSLQEGQTINMQQAIGTKFSYGGLTVLDPLKWQTDGLGQSGYVRWNATTNEFYIEFDVPPPPEELTENEKVLQKKTLPKRN